MENISETNLQFIVMGILVLGLLVIGFLVLVSLKFYTKEWKNNLGIFCFSEKTAIAQNFTNINWIKEVYCDFLEKRNDFFFMHGQIMIAALIVIVLVVLMLTKTISGEAGLPLLSAISGFAIAKTVSNDKNKFTPKEP